MATAEIDVNVHCGFSVGTLEDVMGHAKRMQLNSFVYVQSETEVSEYVMFDGKYRRIANGEITASN
jgi:hypothetical protein